MISLSCHILYQFHHVDHDNVHLESCTEGTVALVGGNGDDMGRVEYCYQGQWYTVCADDFEVTGEEARVICQSLGHYYQSCS